MVVPARDKVLYGVGAFGYGSVNQMLGNFLMFFGTGILGLSGTLMGMAVGISTVWDAVTDPLVGALSDRYRGRWGRRHSFMLVGCLGVAILNLLIWNINPAWGTLRKFVVLLVELLLIETFNTIYSTPYSALGFDMCQTYHERTSIQSYKTVFQSASLMVPSLLMMVVLAPTAYATLNTATGGYQLIAVITSSLCVLTGLVTMVGTRRYRTVAVPDLTHPPVHFFDLLKVKNNVCLIAAYAVALSCSALITTLGMHIFTYTFHFSSLQIPVVMGCLVAGIILGQPLWCRVSANLGKKSTVMVALCVVMVGVVIFALILAGRFWLTRRLLLLVVAGDIFMISVGVGCIYSLPISMFADNIQMENTAMATGFLTFCTKCTNALVTIVVGVLLDLIGFQSGRAVQTLRVSTALGWLLVGGVVLAAMGAWLLFGKYQDKVHENVV